MGHWSTMCTICMDTVLQWPAGKLLATSILTGAPSRLVGAPLDLFRFHLQHNEQPCAGAHARDRRETLHLSAAVKASAHKIAICCADQLFWGVGHMALTGQGTHRVTGRICTGALG